MSLHQRFSRRPFKPRGRFWRINYGITALTVRLLDEKGKQIGVFSKQEASRRAKEAGLDLVEIAPLAKPPVCKIIDFKKFKYIESKKERESKKKSRSIDLKQIMLSPFIGKHDLETKENKAREFLKDGDRVKIIVRFHGRQFSKKSFGFDLINKVIQDLGDVATVEREPKFEGPHLAVQLIPVKKRSSNETKDQKNETKDQKSDSQTIQTNQKGKADAKTTKQQTSKVKQEQETKT